MKELTNDKIVKMKLKELQECATELNIEKIYKYNKEHLKKKTS